MDFNAFLQIIQEPVFLAGIISGLGGSSLVAWQVGKHQKKNREFDTIQRIFDILGDEKHRQARKEVFRAYEKFVANEQPNFGFYEAIEEKVEIVRADFDQIGLLIYGSVRLMADGTTKQGLFKRGYVPEKTFFEAYAGSTVNSWTALEHFIEYQRNTKFSKGRFMVFFQHMAKEAYKFHKVKGASKIQSLKNEHADKLDRWMNELKNDREGKEESL